MEIHFGYALLLTALAGMATMIGSFIGLAVKDPGPKFMGFMLGFSAGVMILISFVEMLQESIRVIGFLPAHAGFFVGMICFFLIDNLVPHEYVGQHDYEKKIQSGDLKRVGLLVALGVGVHNLPEGMVTFVSALENVQLGVAIAVAIAIHNIPEGLAVSAPVYAATGSRKKAFFWSFLSGVSEPVGAALAGLILLPFLTHAVLAWVLAFVAGIMVGISLDELIPVAKSFDTEHTPILGVIFGMAVMAISLQLLR